MTDGPTGRSSLDKAANEEVPTLKKISLYLGIAGCVGDLTGIRCWLMIMALIDDATSFSCFHVFASSRGRKNT